MVDRVGATDFVFVYGTLMKGHQKDWQGRVGARLVGRGRIKGRLYDLGDYPGAVRVSSDSNEFVKGELYQVQDRELATKVLDEYEEFYADHPRRSLFVRSRVPVILEDGKRKIAWAYFYNRPIDRAELIPSGDYRESLSARR